MQPTAQDGDASSRVVRESEEVSPRGEALERMGRERIIVAMRIMRKNFQEVINQLMSVFGALRCECGGSGDGRDLTAVS